MKDFKRNLYVSLGKKIKSKRTELGINQSQVANQLNVSRATISNIEVGRHQIPLHLLYNLTEILSVDISHLLPNNEEVIGLTLKSDIKSLINTKATDEDVEFILEQYNKI